MKKILAIFVAVVAMGAMMGMWFSGRFIPVYVEGEYVLANQIVRYMLYFLLVCIIIYCLYVADNEEKKRRNSRRRR